MKLAPSRTLTTDADALAFLVGQLEYIEPTLYETRYRGIVYQELVPVDSSAGPWAETISFEMLDSRTKAQFINPASDDIPYADVGLSKTPIGVQHAGLGYSYTTQDLRVAAATGRPVDSLRAQAVQRGVEELAQTTCFLGSSDHSLPGFLNNSLITPGAPTTGNWLTTATDRNIMEDINNAITGIWDGTSTVEVADTVLLPPTLFGHIAGMPVEDTAFQTVCEWLKKNTLYTALTGNDLTIRALSELETAGAGSTTRMVVYRRSPDVLTYHFPMPLQFQAPQLRNLTWHIPGEFRISGTQIRYPGAVSYTDDLA